MSYGDIASHVEEMYGINLSTSAIGAITASSWILCRLSLESQRAHYANPWITAFIIGWYTLALLHIPLCAQSLALWFR